MQHSNDEHIQKSSYSYSDMYAGIIPTMMGEVEISTTGTIIGTVYEVSFSQSQLESEEIARKGKRRKLICMHRLDNQICGKCIRTIVRQMYADAARDAAKDAARAGKEASAMADADSKAETQEQTHTSRS